MTHRWQRFVCRLRGHSWAGIGIGPDGWLLGRCGRCALIENSGVHIDHSPED